MATRAAKRKTRRPPPKVNTSFGPLEIPGTSGNIIDLTTDSPRNELFPTQLVGSCSPQANRGRRAGNVLIFGEVIDLSDTTPTKESVSEKRSAEEPSDVSPSKKQSLSSPAPGCPICLEKLEFVDPPQGRQVTTTQCGHMYCKACILPVIKENGHCPKCRKKQTVRNLVTLFA